MTTSKKDASLAGKLMHSSSSSVRKVAASDLAQAAKHSPKKK